IQRQRGEAELSGTCIDGKSQWIVGADFFDRSHWQSGARSGDADGGSDPGQKARDLGWRQELRHPGIRPGAARDEHHSARRAKRHLSFARDRSANRATYELRSEPAETKTSRAVVWVDEDGRNAQESEVTRDGQGGVAVHFYGSGLQSLPIKNPDGPSMIRVSPRAS